MAFLDVREVSESTDYSYALKVPAAGRSVWPISVELTNQCRLVDRKVNRTARLQLTEADFSCNWRGHQQIIMLKGVEGGYVEVLVRYQDRTGRTSSAVVTAAGAQINLSVSGSSIWERINLGVDHILSGLDHLLFVAGLLLITQSISQLVGAITAFTLAHSITLAGSTVGLISVPSQPVEAFIAFSIVYLAASVVYQVRRNDHEAEAIGNPTIMAFGFGLVHGFGFAGALSDTGVSGGNLIGTLFLFNVGVEIGQLLFIAFVISLVWSLRNVFRSLVEAKWAKLAAAYGIGAMGTYWVIERMLAFWPALRHF